MHPREPITQPKLEEPRRGSAADADYERLFQAISQPMTILERHTLRILDVNKAALREYGYTRDEFLQMTIGQVQAEGDASAQSRHYFTEHRRKDGTRFEVEIHRNATLFRGRDCWLASASDVTARRSAERSLAVSEQRFRRLFEGLPIAMDEVDSEGLIRRVNRAHCNLLGLGEEHLVGRAFWEFMPAADFEFHQQIFRRTMAGERPEGPIEHDYVRPDGKRLNLVAYPIPVLNGTGQVAGVRVARLDMTVRKQVEQTREEQKRLAQLSADVSTALAAGDSAEVSLKICAQAVVEHLDAALVRIWTLNQREQILELRASAGMYTDLNGEHARVPMGQLRVGRIAAERRPHLTNAVIGDAWIEQDWAQREGLVAFAGYPLIVDKEVVGVLGMFARHWLTPAALEALESAARGIALGIQRNQTEYALRTSEARYRRIIDTAAEGIWSADLEGRATFVNERMGEILGYRPPDLIGRTLFDFILPEEFDDIANRIEALHQGNQQSFDFRLWRPDGTALWVSIGSTPIRDEDGGHTGYLSMFTDITERKRAEQALIVSEEFNKGIVEGLGDGILVLDLAGRFLYLSPAAQWMLEIEDASGYVGTCWLDAWGEEDAKKLETVIENAAAGWRGSFEGPYTTARGVARHLEVSFGAIQSSGKAVSKLVAVVRDVTERKQLEGQLQQSQKLESIGQLAAGIAHEINTPIQYVGDNARFLKDAFRELQPKLELDQLPPAHREEVEYLCDEIPKALDQLLEGADQVARIVRAMKDFSHPGSIEKTAVDLNRAIQSTILVSRNEWKYAAELVEDLASDLPPVWCMPGEINQVILNLIVNAAHAIADAARGGSGELGTITVSSRSAKDCVEIAVRDTGTGIPESIRTKVFDHFFTTKEVGKGTGQGLALAHAVVVKKHGGSIWFETEVGVGTTFIVRLPINTAEGA